MTDQAATPAAEPTIAAADEPAITALDDAPGGAVAPGAASAKKNVHTTTFDDDTVRNYEFDLYKGRKNITDRIGILDVNQITWGRIHFAEKLGYFICHSEWKTVGGQEVCQQMAPCCEKLEAPEKRFATLIIHYNTNPQGVLAQPFAYALKLWRFSASKYIELRDTNKEWPLADHDLKLHCEDDQYQRIKITPFKDKVTKNDLFQKKHWPEVAQWVKTSTPKLQQQVAKVYTPRELLEKLGMAQTPAVVQQQATVDDIKELLTD